MSVATISVETIETLAGGDASGDVRTFARLSDYGSAGADSIVFAQDEVALDKNYSAHYAFIDYFFRTVVKTDEKFPEKYGVVGDYVPAGFIKQQMYPLKKLPSSNPE